MPNSEAQQGYHLVVNYSTFVGIALFIINIVFGFAVWSLRRKLERFDELVEQFQKMRGEHETMMRICPAGKE